MPDYEYHCTACNSNFVITRRMSVASDPLTLPPGCKLCGSTSTLRVYDSPDVVYHGSGWAGKDEQD